MTLPVLARPQQVRNESRVVVYLMRRNRQLHGAPPPPQSLHHAYSATRIAIPLGRTGFAGTRDRLVEAGLYRPRYPGQSFVLRHLRG